MKRPGLPVGPLARALRSDLKRVRSSPADADAVHDSRVAARKLLVAGELGTFAPPTDLLRRVVKRLGRVRNLDVAMEILVRGPVSEGRALSAVLLERRRKEAKRLARWLTAERVRKVWRSLRDAAPPDLLSVPGDELRTYFTGLSSISTRLLVRPGAETAHEVRREVRRLRYAFEAAAGSFPPRDRRAIARILREAQESAGRWHDLCVLEQLAHRAVREERMPSPPDLLLRRLRSQGQAQSRRFHRALRNLLKLRRLFLPEETGP